GTRGGGMDHAAVLASRAGHALLVHFTPVKVEHVPVPAGWRFLVAHSLTTAQKSGAVRAEYNSRRTAGTRGRERLGFPTFADAVGRHTFEELATLAGRIDDGEERRCFLHVVGEAFRVSKATSALRAGDAPAFGDLLNASHGSLRDLLRVSSPDLDELVEAACAAGALGARLTGAGFGGCAVVLAPAEEVERVRQGLVDRYYSKRSGFIPEMHLITAQPSAGALA
ncbi:MAG TPA: hypothetical protein VHA11_13225, partial [Bryobacteraceae bacterium]|nr:hypothetical protein [Bryobacteraceae bacterium]